MEPSNDAFVQDITQGIDNLGYTVIAADKTLDSPIKSLGCEAHQLDVTSPSSISQFKEALADQPVDLLLNIAGVMSLNDTLDTVTLPDLQKTFAVNTFGPLLLTQALLPNILFSSQPKVAVMSSRMGSIADNSSGGQYAYRASKAAVNAVFKSLAVDLRERGVVVVLLHPGIVRTGMTSGFEELKGAVEPGVAAGNCGGVKEKGAGDSGKWWHRNGEELPW
ncbi:hypothetical protein N0V90_005816 [Kalmusia sp. IMI 367209]|nr:hypothetical protein N0V90_005816 [Kalmusia sp. IMI 367209]